jgi:hypothetical protein
MAESYYHKTGTIAIAIAMATQMKLAQPGSRERQQKAVFPAEKTAFADNRSNVEIFMLQKQSGRFGYCKKR